MSTNISKKGYFSYNKLFKLLIDKGIKKKGLCELAGISATSLAKLGRGGNGKVKLKCRTSLRRKHQYRDPLQNLLRPRL